MAGDVHRLASPALKFIEDFIALPNHMLLFVAAQLMGTCTENLIVSVTYIHEYSVFISVFSISQMHFIPTVLIARTVSLKQPWVKCLAQGQSSERAVFVISVRLQDLGHPHLSMSLSSLKPISLRST